jgi:hypothetical protein
MTDSLASDFFLFPSNFLTTQAMKIEEHQSEEGSMVRLGQSSARWESHMPYRGSRRGGTSSPAPGIHAVAAQAKNHRAHRCI